MTSLWPLDEVAGTHCQCAFVRKAQEPRREQPSGWEQEPQRPPSWVSVERPHWLGCKPHLSEQEHKPENKYHWTRCFMTSYYLLFSNIRKCQTVCPDLLGIAWKREKLKKQNKKKTRLLAHNCLSGIISRHELHFCKPGFTSRPSLL